MRCDEVDTVLEDNSGPLKDTIANLKTFSDGLARNTGKIDGILAGLEKMTGGGAPAQKITYDLRTAAGSGADRQDAVCVAGHSRADRGRDAPDAAHVVLAQRGQPGLCRFPLGRQHSKAGAGASDRQFRELRHCPRAAAHERSRAGGLPAPDRHQALWDRHARAGCGSRSHCRRGSSTRTAR